jgi:hypothetical protein
MAKIYRSITDKNGLRIEKSSDTLSDKSIEKSIEILSGDGIWKHFHGYKLMIDPSGICIKGPDIFIGRKWDDLQRLTFNDGLTVMQSVARATSQTNKSFEDSIDKSNRKKAWKEAVETLDKLIKARKDYDEQKFKRYN